MILNYSYVAAKSQVKNITIQI